MKIPKNTKLLITGAPRSGTYFTTRLLFNLGLDIRHESIDKNGTVSSVHLINPTGFTKIVHQIREPLKSICSLHKVDWLGQELQLESKNDENFTGHFNLNQLHKKNDDIGLRTDTWSYFLNKVKDRNLTRKCMKAYLYWNELAVRESEFTYTLEGVLESKVTFNSWLESLGLIPEEGDYLTTLNFIQTTDITNKELGSYSTNNKVGGIKVAPDLNWEILESLDSELVSKIKDLTGSFYS